MIPPPPRRTPGSVLMPTLFILATVFVFVGVAFNLTGQVGRFSDRAVVRQKALAIADGCLELQFAQWCTILQYGITFAPPSSAFDNISLPTASMFPGVANFTATRGEDASCVVSNYKIRATDPLDTPLPADEKPTMISTNYPAINIYHYLATVDVTLPTRSGPVTVRLSRVFQLQNRSPWSYAIFAHDDLEIHPGAKMVITGDVHTNKNMYLGAGGGALTFKGIVEACGTITVGKSPKDPSPRDSRVTPTYELKGQPRSGVESQTPLGISESSLTAADSNQNNDSYREIIEAPVGGGSDPFTPPEKQTLRYYNMADYKITVSNSTNNITQSGTIAILDSSNQPVSASSNLYKVFVNGGKINGTNYTAILSTSGTMKNAREGSSAIVRTTSINVGALKTAVDGGIIPANSAGLLLYITDTRPKATVNNKLNEPALFIDNGNFLPSNGLTLVSDNPVYVQGDYNTGQSDSTKLLSNKTTGGASTSGTYWEPAAIIGDAITILSNKWTVSSTGSSAAGNTTVNAAFMAGSMYSDGDSYSGGIENFPRFLENWSGIRFTYYGSMVWLYESKQATAPWGGSGIYSPPDRYWYFDERFYTRTPPGTFMVPSYQKLRWFTR